MPTCGSCGHPQTGGEYCTQCGTRFPGNSGSSGNGAASSRAGAPPDAFVSLLRRVPGLGQPGGRTARGLAVAVLAVAVGTASWLLVASFGSGGSAHGGGSSAAPASGGTAPAAPASPGGGTPSPGANPDSLPPGSVTIAPAASGNDAAEDISQFFYQYFSAVNSHDYSDYIALFAPGVQVPSSSQFDSGYGSTTDSGEVLAGISDADPGGDVVAHLTFTSHQDPSQSPNRANCDKWDVNFYLFLNLNDNYLIDTPPSGYHARYTACS